MHKSLKDIVKGTTYNGAEFSITVNGQPLDLTGTTIKMDLKQFKTAETALVFSTIDGTITLGAPGVFYIAPRVIDIPAGEYRFDIRFLFLDGTIKTYCSGTWKVLQNVTD